MGTKQTAEFRHEVVRVAVTSELSRWIKEERSNITPSEPRIDLIQENEHVRK